MVFVWKTLRKNSEDLGVYEKKMLKTVLEKECVRMWIRLYGLA